MLGAMANMVGLGPAGEEVAYDCKWPNQPIENDDDAKELLEKHYAQACAFHQEAESYELIHSFKDPEEDGDMKMYTAPRVGTYHRVKATFTLKYAPEKLTDVVFSPSLEVAKKYSADCSDVQLIAEPTADSNIVHRTFWAPPPVAHRDFVFLMGRRKHDDGSVIVWGITVAHKDVPERGYLSNTVRAASIFSWKVVPMGEVSLCTYITCFDIRGWTPAWILDMLKTVAAKELCAIRAVASGKEAKLTKTELADVGVTAEEAEKQKEVGKHHTSTLTETLGHSQTPSQTH